MYPGPEEGPYMNEFATAVVICGTIVVFSMELVKRLWKQHFEKFPSWLGICCGIWLSGMATFVYCSEWQSGYRWLLVWAGAFLFQYFISMYNNLEDRCGVVAGLPAPGWRSDVGKWIKAHAEALVLALSAACGLLAGLVLGGGPRRHDGRGDPDGALGDLRKAAGEAGKRGDDAAELASDAGRVADDLAGAAGEIDDALGGLAGTGDDNQRVHDLLAELDRRHGGGNPQPEGGSVVGIPGDPWHILIIYGAMTGRASDYPGP